MDINTTANHMGIGENVVIDIHFMYINTTANNMGGGGGEGDRGERCNRHTHVYKYYSKSHGGRGLCSSILRYQEATLTTQFSNNNKKCHYIVWTITFPPSMSSD